MPGKTIRNSRETFALKPKLTAVLTALPFHHRDPFDRLIIAQAMVERRLDFQEAAQAMHAKKKR